MELEQRTKLYDQSVIHLKQALPNVSSQPNVKMHDAFMLQNVYLHGMINTIKINSNR